MQTDASAPNIVGPLILGVVASVLAVVCKQMQQLPTMLGPAVHRKKDSTHKTLETMCDDRAWPQQIGRAVQMDPKLLPKVHRRKPQKFRASIYLPNLSF